MVNSSDVGEDHFDCQDCEWTGLFAKLNPDLDGLATICPECGSESVETVRK